MIDAKRYARARYAVGLHLFWLEEFENMTIGDMRPLIERIAKSALDAADDKTSPTFKDETIHRDD